MVDETTSKIPEIEESTRGLRVGLFQIFRESLIGTADVKQSEIAMKASNCILATNAAELKTFELRAKLGRNPPAITFNGHAEEEGA